MSDVEGLVNAAIERGALPGATVIVVGRDGVREEVTAGRTSIEGGDPVTPETMFRLASMTKALASVAALQLVEQGRVGLDDAVTAIVPGEVQVLDGFDGDTPVLRAPASPPTLRQLLSHTAGHGYFFLNEDLVRYHEVAGVPSILTGERAALATPLVADPGTRWEYGINTDWVGLVVEAISGQSLGDYLAEHVFGPLGMTDTTFTPTPEQRARLMRLHQRQPDGSLGFAEIDLPETPEWHAGGHGAYGTARDYARFVTALLRDGELDGARILQAETVELALSDQLGGIALPELLRSTVPELSNDVPALPFEQGWGLGFHLMLEDVPGMRHAGSGDWAGLFNSYFWIDRAGGTGVVFMTQVLPFFDHQVIETLLGVEQAVYAIS